MKHLYNAVDTVEDWLRTNTTQPTWRQWLDELLVFGIKNAAACFFPVIIFVLLFITNHVSVPGIYRYDLLLLLCLGVQAYMYFSSMESKEELKIICVFHLLGVGMEWWKVSHGVWAYPDPALTKLFGVPLFSGFMYASVASFITQSWKYFATQLHGWPPVWQVNLMALAIYGNFFANQYVTDIRWVLIPLLVLMFWNTSASFTTNGQRRTMPITLSFLFITFFIWIAENICTYLGAWQYTDQAAGWKIVPSWIIGSWFLLVIVSFILVAQIKSVHRKSYS